MAEEAILEAAVGPATASPKASIISVPLPRRTRSQSSGSEFPPPIRRTSTEASRPVPFAAKFQRVHPGTTGVTVLEHLERLDAVEASLQRLGVDDQEEEVDVGVAPLPNPVQAPAIAHASSSNTVTSPFSPPGSPLATVHEVSSSASSIAEEDLAAMSKSTSYVEGLSSHSGRRASVGGRGIDWMHSGDASQKRTVIVEVGTSFSLSHL
jgi:phosphatidylinositol 4-kinase type 2